MNHFVEIPNPQCLTINARLCNLLTQFCKVATMAGNWIFGGGEDAIFISKWGTLTRAEGTLGQVVGMGDLVVDGQWLRWTSPTLSVRYLGP